MKKNHAWQMVFVEAEDYKKLQTDDALAWGLHTRDLVNKYPGRFTKSRWCIF